MRWVRSEYILKGIFLGLILFVALQNPDWATSATIALWMTGGLAAGLVLGVAVNIRDLSKLLSKPVAFLLFLVLENPLLVYAGVIFGLAGGVFAVKTSLDQANALTNIVGGAGLVSFEMVEELRVKLLLLCVGGGAIIGFGFGELRQIRDFRYRLVLSFIVASLLVAALWAALNDTAIPYPIPDADRPRLGILILLSLPFFYLLTFTGVAEESEIEIAVECAMLGIGIHLTNFAPKIPALAFLLPITLYFIYATRFLNGLRIFKHVVRGYCYLRLNKIKFALTSARRALELDRKSVLGNQLMVTIHHDIDLDLALRDPEILDLLDINRCTNRVAALLIGAKPPTAVQLEEANKLLMLVERQAPNFLSHVDYYRAVAALHAKRTDEAAGFLNHLLDPAAWPPDDVHRKSILFSAWQLALLGHPAMKPSVGEPQLAKPGRRVEAIQAIERHLGDQADDPDALILRRRLYGELTEAEYLDAAGNQVLADFDYGLIGQEGAELIKGENWQRGAEYLRIVAHGVPNQSPGIFQKLAEVCRQRGLAEAADRYLHLVKQAGLDLGVKALPPDQKQIFFATVKQLADAAAAGQNWDEAIQDYSIYTQFEGSGKETLRKLAEVYAAKKDPASVLEALRVTEKAIVYGTDKDLQDKKDSYYYSVPVEALQTVRDDVKGHFDVAYCVKKGKALLDSRDESLDILDWAEHLISLALVMQPKNLIAMVQRARCHLRRGESEKALQMLEDVRELKPSGNDESDAWYFAVKQLGMLYLDSFSRGDLALGCFEQFQESLRSGADTHYHIGRCYESLGDHANAIKSYRNVTHFEEHPLRWDAEEAIRRLKGQVGSPS